jgi:hypothetical protein
VASGCEAKGLERSLSDNRVDLLGLQPAQANEINASAATWDTRCAHSNSVTQGMVTHSHATKSLI